MPGAFQCVTASYCPANLRKYNIVTSSSSLGGPQQLFNNIISNGKISYSCQNIYPFCQFPVYSATAANNGKQHYQVVLQYNDETSAGPVKR